MNELALHSAATPLNPDRRNFVGGSDIAKIIGVSKFGTTYELYLEKRGEIPPKQQEAKVLQRGKRLEPAIVAMYMDETDSAVTYPGRLIIGDEPWKRGSFDAERTEERIGVEAKSVSEYVPRHEWGPAGSDDVPKDYLAQTLWYLGLSKWDRFDVAALLGADDFRIYPIYPDLELFQAMEAQAREFWMRVQAGEPPDPDFGHRSTHEVINRKFGIVDPKLIVQADPQLLHWARVAQEARALATQYDKTAEAAKDHLLHALGNGSVLDMGDTQLVRKIVKKKAYTVEATEYIDARFKKTKEAD